MIPNRFEAETGRGKRSRGCRVRTSTSKATGPVLTERPPSKGTVNHPSVCVCTHVALFMWAPATSITENYYKCVLHRWIGPRYIRHAVHLTNPPSAITTESKLNNLYLNLDDLKIWRMRPSIYVVDQMRRGSNQKCDKNEGGLLFNKVSLWNNAYFACKSKTNRNGT